MTDDHYLAPTDESFMAVLGQGIEGPVTMLNLLRFRAIADYSDSPELAPEQPITGAAAYRRYIDAASAVVANAGGEVSLLGTGGAFIIGPLDERWDAVLIVKQQSLEAFGSFTSDPDYIAVAGHRTAALEDSRILPIVEGDLDAVFGSPNSQPA
ncbi:MAG: DUF1330 domain-containing protein [Acidimicrobiales bacterium]